MMTLDEAITHAQWCADNSCGECADDHRQLAEWLRQLADEQRKVLILMTEVNSLRTENEKLRTLVRNMWDVALHPQLFGDGSYLLKRMRELGIEVDG